MGMTIGFGCLALRLLPTEDPLKLMNNQVTWTFGEPFDWVSQPYDNNLG